MLAEIHVTLHVNYPQILLQPRPFPVRFTVDEILFGQYSSKSFGFPSV